MYLRHMVTYQYLKADNIYIYIRKYILLASYVFIQITVMFCICIESLLHSEINYGRNQTICNSIFGLWSGIGGHGMCSKTYLNNSPNK